MSTVISSFLIEPVLRHARRFSGSGSRADVPRHYVPHGSSEQALAEIEDRIPPSETMDSESDEHSAGVPDAEPGSEAIITESPLVHSPDIEPSESPFPELPPRYRSTNSLPRAQTLPPQPRRVDAIRSRGASDPANDETSSNPEHGIPERFNSRNNSTSSTANSPVRGSATPDGIREITVGDEDNRRSSQYGSPSRSQALPEDDGMGPLRKQIIEIREMDISNLEKARLVHNLMTQRVTVSHPNASQARPQSPSSLLSQERSGTPSSLRSNVLPNTSTPLSIEFGPDLDNPYYVTEEDRRPTYRPKDTITPTPGNDTRMTSSISSLGDESIDAEEDVPQLGCKHYKRNVKLRCSICRRWYTCRFCHDEVEDHTLVRRETKYMLCMLCGSPQAAGDHCTECGERSAWYYCNICKLWDDDPEKSIYHCDDCGICRVGKGLGKDFFHCKTCGVCMSISLANSHRCIERSTDCDCPICGEYMFTSPDTVVFMPCGHSIHHKCYYLHMQSSYRCPICSKSMVNMETQFRNLDRTIESQPMPEQFRDTKAFVYCNDCCAKSLVSYHWLGLKCAVCDSYNTAQLRMLSDQDNDADMELPSSPLVGTSMIPGEGLDDPQPAPPIPVSGVAAAVRPVSRGRALRGVATTGRDQSPIASNSDATQTRRPTSYTGPSTELDGRRFSPYPLGRRIGRSVSPLTTGHFLSDGSVEDPSTQANMSGVLMGTLTGASTMMGTEHAGQGDDDDELSFWGGGMDGRSRTGLFGGITSGESWGDDDDEDMDSEEEDEEEEDEDDDDDDEANDGWNLIGHR